MGIRFWAIKQQFSFLYWSVFYLQQLFFGVTHATSMTLQEATAMRNILLELKKMMYYRKGFWCIVLFLAASLLSLAVTAQPQNLDMEKYWDGYTYYLEQVAGPYSSEKAAYI